MDSIKSCNTSNPHFGTGMRLQFKGQFVEALEAFERWLTEEPENTVAWNCKGIALHGLTRYEDAMQCFREALRLIPDDPPTTGNMGRTLYAMGNYEEAAQWLEKSLAASPEAGYWSLRGTCLLELGRLTEALSCYQQARTLNPKKAEFWSNEGTVHSRLGSDAEALNCLKEAVEVESDYAIAWYNKANAEEQLGENDAALQSYQKFLSLQPTSMEAAVAKANEAVKRLGTQTLVQNVPTSEFPRPTTVIFRTCMEGSYESLSQAIENMLLRYPQIPHAIFDGAKIRTLVTEELDATSFLPTGGGSLEPMNTEDLRECFPNSGRNGVVLRHLIRNGEGRDVHELVVYWSKTRAEPVRAVIPDVEQM